MLRAGMSGLRLLPLAAVALTAAACGSSGPTGTSAAKVVKGDWEFNHAFTGLHARYAQYDTVEEIRCAPRPNAHGNIFCRLRVASSTTHRTARARVVVHYDQQDILVGW